MKDIIFHRIDMFKVKVDHKEKEMNKKGFCGTCIGIHKFLGKIGVSGLWSNDKLCDQWG